jgi:hypothetical protein
MRRRILADGGAVARENHGFRRVEVLPGNVGLLELTLFSDFEPDQPLETSARAVADAALALLARCQALMVDLRDCRGGSPARPAALRADLGPYRIGGGELRLHAAVGGSGDRGRRAHRGSGESGRAPSGRRQTSAPPTPGSTLVAASKTSTARWSTSWIAVRPAG